MAVRRVTRTYASVVEFLEDRASTLGQGMLLLPPDSVRGELAAELKLDLVVPPLGRLGPIPAQVVHRGSDGSVGLRLPEIPARIHERFDELDQAVADIRRWLVDQGELVPADQVPAPAPAPTAAAPAAAPAAPAAPAALGAAPARRGRGFPVPDVSGRPPTMEGTRAPSSIRNAMVQLAADKATGLLTLRRPDGQVRYGFWDRGGPVGFRTDPIVEGEVLGVLLYKAEQISKQQLRESLRIMEEKGCRQGDAFIEMGLMSFPQLAKVLTKQVEFVLQRALQDTEGTWTFHALDTLPERFLPQPLRVPGLIFRTLFKRARNMKGETIYESLAADIDRYVYVPDDIAALVPEMGLSPSEVRLVGTIRDNSWRLRELYSVSPMSRAVTAATMWAFRELGFVVFRDQQSDARANAALQAIIDRKKMQVFKGTHFEILEVHWICLQEEVDAAYERLEEEYRPARFAQMDAEAREEVAKINAALEAAYKVLRDARSRREYRREVIEDSKIVQSAELLAKQGDMALMRQDRRAAVMCFGKAAELVPSRAEFRQSLTRARGLGR